MKKPNNLICRLAFALSLLFYGITAQAAVVDLTDANTFPNPAFRTALQTALGATSVEATSVTSLDLSNQGITDITGIANFTELTELNISDNNVTEIDLRSNTALKTLEMRNNTVISGFGSSAPNKMYIPSGLKKLDAEGCSAFHYISGITTYCTGLEWLSFKNCNITAYSPGVTGQKGLKYLDYSGNNVGSWNTDITTLTNLTYLDYSGNLTTTPTSINVSALKKLECLNLSNNGKLQYANVSGLSELREFNMSGNDMYWGTQTNSTNKLTPANCPKLEVLILDNANILTAPTVDGFQNLKTLSVGGSANKFTSGTVLTLNNCPAIENINVSGAANITSVAIKNSNLTSIPTIVSTGCTKLKTLVLDGNQFTEIPAVSAPFTCLSLQNNKLDAVFTLSGNTLEGLDLGSNGLTSVTVENSAMSALSLAGNADLTELHLHGNANLTKTASTTGISAAQGLYIKGLANLETLDIENSSFEELGQSNSTQGCSGLKTLKAAHNKFKTFSNAYNDLVKGGGEVARPMDATRSSLEHLTGLKYLDLSHNELKDSLHLYRNTELETLIVHHNRTIERYDNLTDYLANTKVRNKNNVNGGKGKSFIYDIPYYSYYGAYNDTTGLRMLNLVKNTKLKYIDISYTAIQNTAAGQVYMSNFATKETEVSGHNEPHFIYIQPCHATLEEIYADYNGMMTFGYITNVFTNLKRISQIETRGQHFKTMQGSLNPNLNGTIPNVEYINVANSDLDSIGVSKLAHLKYLNVSGNWTKNNWSHWSSDGVGHTLNLKGNGELVECVADDCPHLVIVQANDKTNLTSLSLNNNPELQQVYVPNTGLARINNNPYNKPAAERTLLNSDEPYIEETSGLGLAGLNTAANLELLYCEDNAHLTSLDVTANSNLKYLHAYNNKYGVSGLDLSHNAGMVSAWVSNSDLEGITLTGCAALDTLKCYDNAALAALDVTESPALRYLDLARCHVRDLDVKSNTALEYFDCSNDEKCDETLGNWLSDLNFTSTALKKVYANNNDLYCIKLPTSLPSLTNIEYEHNHINGIDLRGASALAAANIKDQDNGRTIVAECANWGEKKLYYFQLTENAGDHTADDGYNTFLASKASKDVLKPEEGRESLADDGFVVANATAWTTGVSGVVNGTKKKAATIDEVPADKIVGNIVVLIPTEEPAGGKASGHAEYTYNNGKGNSTFYLDWTADSQVITGVDDLNASAEVASVTYYNLAGVASQEPFDGVNLVVKTMTDGSTVTTKMIK